MHGLFMFGEFADQYYKVCGVMRIYLCDAWWMYQSCRVWASMQAVIILIITFVVVCPHNIREDKQTLLFSDFFSLLCVCAFQRDLFNLFLIQAAIKSPKVEHHRLAR